MVGGGHILNKLLVRVKKKTKPFSKKEWNKNLKQVLRSFPEALISIRAETYLWELLQYPMMEDTKH